MKREACAAIAVSPEACCAASFATRRCFDNAERGFDQRDEPNVLCCTKKNYMDPATAT